MLVERVEAPSGWIVWDHRDGASIEQKASQGIAVVSSIGQQLARRRQTGEQAMSHSNIADLARRDREGDEAARTVRDHMDLGAAATTRTAYGLEIGPPFPPAAERWAFAVVLSIN